MIGRRLVVGAVLVVTGILFALDGTDVIIDALGELFAEGVISRVNANATEGNDHAA